jgi:hypothetical protein
MLSPSHFAETGLSPVLDLERYVCLASWCDTRNTGHYGLLSPHVPSKASGPSLVWYLAAAITSGNARYPDIHIVSGYRELCIHYRSDVSRYVQICTFMIDDADYHSETMMVPCAPSRKCVGEIFRLKSRMGFHPGRECCIVLRVRDDLECSGYTLLRKQGLVGRGSWFPASS